MTEKKVFKTIGREEVPFEVDGEDYMIRQASGAATRKYREAALAGTEMDFTGEGDDAKRTMRKIQGIAGVEPTLASECTFKLPENKPITIAQFESWPGDIQKWVFGEAKRISPYLEEKDKDLDGLKKERELLDAKIKRLEGNSPKA